MLVGIAFRAQRATRSILQLSVYYMKQSDVYTEDL